ncbi:3-mercaptopyruvate sulfurtransferase [Aestuariispira insulae]|uniref:3-mercaptopyruvate sulfurtransferase n=1 Tax=Aestuariispira insulae TaxID=1461337 RepID=A0A3D9HQ07_9PROT|nr:3-mercaptopyruvate sulfurtransferase [Aestuariispira insulae]RED50996.1 thiosulfate/3-mercaptopyruvate sulfurtransferase [Aestuariispira insulae]
MTTSELPSLVEAGWLKENIDRSDLRVIDASWHMPTSGRNAREEYGNGHLPGAVFFDIDAVSDPTHDMPHMLPQPVDFEKAVADLGIRNDDCVVVYDVHGLFSAARVWWMFRVFGHEKVAILNGGLEAWKAVNGAMETGFPNVTASRFRATYHAERVRSLKDMEHNLVENRDLVIDARSAARFSGEAPEPRPGLRGGHMPGAKNLPFDTLLEMDSKKVLPISKLRSLLAPLAPASGQGLVFSCGTGVTACVLAFGFHLIGKDDTAVYDGSWTEWASQSDTPVEVG